MEMKMNLISRRALSFKSISAGALVALLALSPTACKKKPTVESSNADANSKIAALASGPATPAQRHIPGSDGVSIDGGSGYANVTYSTAVKQFDESEVRASLQGIASDGHSWLFKNASAGIKALKTDDIFMVKGAMAGKVLGVVNQDDQTLIVLAPASMKDTIAGGDMKLNAPVHFHGDGQMAQVEPKPIYRSIFDLIEPPVYAAQSVETIIPNAARDAGTKDAIVQSIQGIAGSTVSGWTVTQYSFTPGQSVCNFQIVLVKDVGGFVARVGAKGTISDFDFATNLDWSKTVATGGKYIGPGIFNSVKNMQGTIQFDWEIGKQSPGVWATEDRVALPGGISIPLAPLLGGMPLTLDVSSALLIHPALTGGNEFSRGGFSITWGGGGSGGGFSTTSEGAVTNGDQGGNINLTYKITNDENISPVAPNAMVISYCAPRIELRFDILGPFASSLSTVGGYIDKAVNLLSGYLPASVKSAIANSPLSKMTASNVLASNADVYVQFIATEGVTHSSNITPAPCTKTQIKFTGEGGLSAQFFGLTDGAKKSTDFFTKDFTEWNPGSNFCKSV
jgi:hypothetical protein